MTEKQQTAVQWFYKMILKAPSDISESELLNGYKYLYEQALEIERVQIIEAYASGSNDRLKNRINEQYYTETYNKNKQ